MRLDLFLKKIRIIKTRAKSNILCKKGYVFLNDAKAKPSKEIKVGDLIKIDFGKRLLLIEVIKIPDGNVPKSALKSFFNVITDKKIDII